MNRNDKMPRPTGISPRAWEMWQHRNPLAGRAAHYDGRLQLSPAQGQLVAVALMGVLIDTECTEQDQREASQVLGQLGYKESEIQGIMRDLR
ncbi:hypothetical protein MKJ04_11510 [Pontibacter sp. E15-1]|uniref:hypothetical protein n=1 Tax=Pontibacter sp. E15-1 TaxID=2919918 RepID=UPI001F4F8B41|nr:hypothetical protein [Pontibacter sp. E15-1]MCJ8165471.1 hypothetical protein [Pontibacter sp. E15-1]